MKKTDEQLQQKVAEIRRFISGDSRVCGNEASLKNRKVHYTLQQRRPTT